MSDSITKRIFRVFRVEEELSEEESQKISDAILEQIGQMQQQAMLSAFVPGGEAQRRYFYQQQWAGDDTRLPPHIEPDPNESAYSYSWQRTRWGYMAVSQDRNFGNPFGLSTRMGHAELEKHDARHYIVERDNGGSILAYKWLLDGDMEGEYISPIWETKWEEGCLTADRVPEEDNEHGIWCAKTPDSPALELYKAMSKVWRKQLRLHQIVLGGVVLEHDLGYRAEAACVVGRMEVPLDEGERR